VRLPLASGARTNIGTRIVRTPRTDIYYERTDGKRFTASDLAARYDDSRMLELLDKAAPEDASPVMDGSSRKPLRVGSDIKTPQKIKDAAMNFETHGLSFWNPLRRIYPKVVLDVTIDTDGRVSTVHPLYSHWLLDRDVFDAVGSGGSSQPILTEKIGGALTNRQVEALHKGRIEPLGILRLNQDVLQASRRADPQAPLDPDGCRNAQAFDAQSRHHVEAAVKTGVRGTGVRAERSAADFAPIPLSPPRLRRKPTEAYDVDAGLPTCSRPCRTQRRPSRSSLKCTRPLDESRRSTVTGASTDELDRPIAPGTCTTSPHLSKPFWYFGTDTKW